jgi:hypothetical protein
MIVGCVCRKEELVDGGSGYSLVEDSQTPPTPASQTRRTEKASSKGECEVRSLTEP